MHSFDLVFIWNSWRSHQVKVCSSDIAYIVKIPISLCNLDDLGYCKGSREEKTKMLESKCEQSKSNKRKPRDQNNHHRIDINERVQALQQAMEKANYTKDTHGHKMDKNDPNYGTPQEGSWTALRGQKAHSHVHKVSRNHHFTLFEKSNFCPKIQF